MEKYKITINPIGEDDLTGNPWLLDVLKNKLKQVFMTPNLIIVPGVKDNLVNRIFQAFTDENHDTQMIMGIPGGFMEILVDNTYLIHIIFLTNRKEPSNSRVSVCLTKLQISSSANSDTAPNLNAE